MRGNFHVRLCVQRRLACSAGDRPAGVKARSPVARIAGWRETEILKLVVVPSAGTVWRLPGAVLPEAESAASAIGRIPLGGKPTGQPSVGNPYAGLDAAGAGNVAVGAGLRPTTKGVEKPPDPKVRALALDPTCAGAVG